MCSSQKENLTAKKLHRPEIQAWIQAWGYFCELSKMNVESTAVFTYTLETYVRIWDENDKDQKPKFWETKYMMLL